MLILASQSPRRQMLLKEIYPMAFKIIPAKIDERSIHSDSFYHLPQAISQAKAQYVSERYPSDYVLAADTIVVCNQKVYGKPKNVAEAISMLTELTQNEHMVITGYHIYLNGKDLISSSEVTTLTLAKMTPAQIKAYIDTKSPFDKAGGYGIQDKAIDYVIKSGSYENVLGFPIVKIKNDLIKLGII
ncbi:MAG: Maf family protein [Bacilli bacterium]|nr:Maf family protein [Bacilli bacterium]